MGVRSAHHWQTIIRSLGILLLAAAFVLVTGMATASADAPSGSGSGGGSWNHGSGWNWNGGNNGWSWFRGNRISGCCSNWNVGWNWPFTQIAAYSYPMYMPSYQRVFIPPSYPAQSTTQSFVAQPAQSYVAGPGIGVSQSNLPIACNQYHVALQYGTMTDDPTLDQLCGTSGSVTGTGTSTTTPMYPPGPPSAPSTAPAYPYP